MSLNGLDTPEVQEAYQSAVAEAGGWFLLKYTSRDSVELLSKGKHGVSEARNALVAYAEASPLYGLLMYRRRRILLKYIPEGTSRLLQARTSVHLSDVLERYSPYETLLELTNGDSLNDTALAASFHLHTASPSPSPGRLDELREEEEDDGTLGGSSAANASSASVSGAQRYRADRGLGKRTQRSMPLLHSLSSSTSPTPLSPSSPGISPRRLVSSPTEPEQLLSTPDEAPASPPSNGEPSLPTIAALEKQVEASRNTGSPESESDTIRPATHSGLESESASYSVSPERRVTEFPPRRQSLSAMSLMRSQAMDKDPYDFSQYEALFKPKVKLGPRPINAPEKVKQSTAPRVAAVPGNLKTAPKKQEPPRPQSQGQPYMPRSATAPSALESSAAPSLPPIPDDPVYTPRPMSRGSVRSAPLHKPGPMSADKIRLMKAVELRRKQMRKSQGAIFNPINEEGTEVPEMPKPSAEAAEVAEVADQHQTLSVPEPQIQSKPESEQEHNSTDDESQHQSSKADSGIELRYGTPDTQPTEGVTNETHERAVHNADFDGKDSEAHVSETTSIPVHPSIGLDNGDHDDVQADAVSTTASQTPTERPAASEHDSESTTDSSQILLTNGTQQRSSVVGSVDHSSTQEDVETAEAAEGQHEEPEAVSYKRANSDVAKRRRGYVEPLSIDTSSGNPDDGDMDSDDDDFFDELHSATVEQAKPIRVARSPPALALQGRRPSAETIASAKSVQIPRATASPNEALDHAARPGFAHSSAPSAPVSEKQELASAGRARNVSTGISRRIQALTEHSIRDSSPLFTAPPDISLGGLGAASRRTPPVARPASYRRQSRNDLASTPTSATPTEENRPTWSVKHDPVTNRNTVSVSTRITRPGIRTPTISESTSVDDAMHAPSPPAIEIDAPRSPGHSTKSSESRSLHSPGTRFLMEKENSAPALADFPPPPPNTRITSSVPSLTARDENIAPKEGSKASRFFKRMSVLAGPKKKSGAQSPPVLRSPVKSQSTLTLPQDARPVSIATTAKSDTPPAAVVGDLNVQFPDSLLWKRRIVTIDDYGVLQFAIAQAMDIHRGVAMKRYSLTDFKAPFVPDLDQQELPHSVVLEFDDGTALQVACEDAMTQRQVLSLLSTYWRAYMDNVTDD